MAPGPSAGPDAGEDVEATLRRLHDHLAATAERPVETGASRWLGEAEAVAADVAGGDAPPSVIETRVGQVRDLLAHVDSTGDPEADEHVETARELAESIEAALEAEE